MRVEDILPLVRTWMDLEQVTLKEITSDREKQVLYVISYMWNLKIPEIFILVTHPDQY